MFTNTTGALTFVRSSYNLVCGMTKRSNSLHQMGSHGCIEMMLVDQIKCEGNESVLHEKFRETMSASVTCKSHSYFSHSVLLASTSQRKVIWGHIIKNKN